MQISRFTIYGGTSVYSHMLQLDTCLSQASSLAPYLALGIIYNHAWTPV